MKNYKSILFCCLLLVISLSFSQSIFAQAIAKKITPSDRICGYRLLKGQNVQRVKTENEAKKILDEVMNAAGMSLGTIEIRAAEVGNAFACENDEGNGAFKRYILYNPSWLNALIQEIGTDWTARAILAHEVGHHKKAHSINRETCNPKFEAEADEVAGEALAKMGATLSESQAAFAKIADEDGDDCYPSRIARLAAVEKGWTGIIKPPPPSKSVKKFHFFYQFGNNPGNHIWIKIANNLWIESYPNNGGEAEIQEIGRITVEGDSGILLRHTKLTYLEYFIPDKGGKTMWLRNRANGGQWSFLGEMKGIE